MNLENKLPNKNKIAAIACSASIALLILTIAYTGKFMYLYLVWNLFLAWIPFYITSHLKITKTKWKLLTLISTWLVFFPNAPYIITDIVHFGQNQAIPSWADTILLFSFGWSGLVMGLISLFNVHKVLNQYLKPKWAWAVMSLFMGLSGFGIYLGRIERYNTWDILVNPIGLSTDVFHILTHPGSYPASVGITVAFSLFLLTAYTSVYLLLNKQAAHA